MGGHESILTTEQPRVSAGANVKSVQRMLGHASVAMTLDIYAVSGSGIGTIDEARHVTQNGEYL
jgi:integrase